MPAGDSSLPCTNGGNFADFNTKHRLSAHAVITNDDGEVLQLRQTYGDLRWGLPGGALPFGSSRRVNGKREREHRAAVGMVMGGEGAAVQRGHAADDGKAEA